MSKNKKQHKSLAVQLTEYAVSGGAYFWTGYFILLYLNGYFHSNLGWSVQKSLWWATIISNVIGWSVNFALQRYWAFNNQNLKGHKTQVTGRYARHRGKDQDW
jgi:putative flippase GtrA